MNVSRPVLPATARCSSTSRWRWRAAQHPVLAVGVVIGAGTLLSAIAATVMPALGPATSPHPTLHGTAREAMSIVGQNARTLAVPLLLCAGRWHTGRVTRHVGDLVVATLVIANATIVGLALGRYPTQLPAYLPHLPLEDAAVAIAAGAWLTRRLPGPIAQSDPSLTGAAVLTLLVTIAAAILETRAVPSKG
jgi:hypothetical protein